MADSDAQPKKAMPALDPNSMQDGKLHPGEIFWRDNQPWLQEKGYALRKRYHPDWVPSWFKSPKKPWIECEDGIITRIGHIIDATRPDGSHVVLKRVDTSRHPDEVAIGRLFSSEALASHPSNHCIPILDVLPLPNDDNTVILVMPLLYPNELPPFETIGEVVEFCRQAFEGLQFIHKNHVAHRDCKYDNIMADTAALYISPPHPWEMWLTYDASRQTQQLYSRTQKPVKYYFIDFGLSRLYKPEDAPYLEEGVWGGDKTVPEFLNAEDIPHSDPFPVDVYCLGNAIRQSFVDGEEGISTAKRGLEFMKELIYDMVKEDPKARPTMDQVVTRFSNIIGGLSNWKLRSRLVDVDERPVRGILRSVVHWTKQFGIIATRIPAIPRA
ncbi:hypothetical protein Hypma_007501 [Hypsizygus marmoreus]|uniref:Protein kinase domain-containing protein n=1 Tax=Hypsizygus marmoreus TaxID=39966 RepID=A0A369JTJ5_HYPMA|nr:hypothetical protein Hypma_007501 [Hypsizygus marmoreus]